MSKKTKIEPAQGDDIHKAIDMIRSGKLGLIVQVPNLPKPQPVKA
jgi:hypothetical protein